MHLELTPFFLCFVVQVIRSHPIMKLLCDVILLRLRGAQLAFACRDVAEVHEHIWSDLEFPHLTRFWILFRINPFATSLNRANAVCDIAHCDRKREKDWESD